MSVKKYLIISLATILTVLTACGNSTSTSKESIPTPSIEEPTSNESEIETFKTESSETESPSDNEIHVEESSTPETEPTVSDEPVLDPNPPQFEDTYVDGILAVNDTTSAKYDIHNFVSGIIYEIVDGECNILSIAPGSYLDGENEINFVVPSHIHGYPVVSIEYFNFGNDHYGNGSITIPGTVKRIEEQQFAQIYTNTLIVSEGTEYVSENCGGLYDYVKLPLSTQCDVAKLCLNTTLYGVLRYDTNNTNITNPNPAPRTFGEEVINYIKYSDIPAIEVTSEHEGISYEIINGECHITQLNGTGVSMWSGEFGDYIVPEYIHEFPVVEIKKILLDNTKPSFGTGSFTIPGTIKRIESGQLSGLSTKTLIISEGTEFVASDCGAYFEIIKLPVSTEFDESTLSTLGHSVEVQRY